MVDEEEIAAASAASAEGREYMNAADPSVLRFLIAAREEVGARGAWQSLLMLRWLMQWGLSVACCAERHFLKGESE